MTIFNKITKQDILNNLDENDFNLSLNQIEDYFNLDIENKIDFEGWYLVFCKKLPKNQEVNSLTLFTNAILKFNEEEFKVRLSKNQYLTYQEIIDKD